MSDFVSLERAIRRSTLLASAVCAALLLVSIFSVGFAVHTTWKVRQAAANSPVLVVPGAVAGVYAPGLTEETIRAVARYLAGLGTNFSGLASMDERFDELERFASPGYLPRLQQARSVLRNDVETQGQARVFFGSPGREQLRQSEPGHFEYQSQGRRQVYASGLPMDTRDCVVQLGLTLGPSSQRNPAGIALDRFEVRDLRAIRTDATATGRPGTAR